MGRMSRFSSLGRSLALALVASATLASSGCNKTQPAAQTVAAPGSTGVTVDQIPGHDSLAQDNAQKEEPRLVPAEAYIRTYLTLFGYLYPGELSTKEFATNNNKLFDSWQSYVAALGLPNYASDLPRADETNLLMVAAFERLGIALCDRAVEKDMISKAALADRRIFAFDVPASDAKNPTADVVDLAAFGPRFDVLHLTFLGYPAALAPTDRTNRFFDVYQKVAAAHDQTKSKFSKGQAAWAAVCYGLVRHPEFHLY